LIGEEGAKPEGVVVEIDDQIRGRLIYECQTFSEITACDPSVNPMQQGKESELVVKPFTG
jgi:hypothetical protein